MSGAVQMDGVYMPSEDIVAREIEGELIIVPLVAGIGDLEEALFTVNETGRAIWDRLDGQRTVRDIVAELAATYEGVAEEIQADVVGFLEEVLKRGIVVAAGTRQT